MKKTAIAIRDRLAGVLGLESVIDAGILASLVFSVLLISLLLSIFQLSGAQAPAGLAQAMAGSQMTTAQTAPGYLTPVLLLVGAMAFGIAGAYYIIRRPPT
ncbi:hypothetical protein [Methanocella arvoryzae]|nr:hypothetical protein [Methanocella arvoryzae]